MNQKAKHTFARCAHAIVAAAILTILAGCGSKVEGTYKGPMGQIVLKSGGKAELTMMGQTGQGTYKVDGKSVAVTFDGQTNTFTLEKNCLTGGFGGNFCKD